MRIAVMALRKAAEARMNTRKPMRPSHSTRSRMLISRSFGRYPSGVNSFLAGQCAGEGFLAKERRWKSRMARSLTLCYKRWQTQEQPI
jgi:hypothetical protein